MTIVSMLFPVSIVKKIEEAQRQYFENELVPKAETWNEDRTKFCSQLCIKGETYDPPTLFKVPVMLPNEASVDPSRAVISPCGKYLYVVKSLARGTPLSIFQGRRRGQVFLTTHVPIPVLAEVENGATVKIWMSMTPNEVISQRKGVISATGKVMIGGLGMGWFLQKVCAKPTVKEVILVERDQKLADWLLPVIREKWPHINDKLKDVVVNDAVGQIGKHGEDTRYLLDIWEHYGNARDDKSFQKAKTKYKHVWGWGDHDTASM